MSHRTIALVVIAVTLVLDAVATVLYAHEAHLPVLPGAHQGGTFYFTTVTMFTVGYGDVLPHNRLQYWLVIGMIWSLVPLGGATLALFTSGLTSAHVRKHMQPQADATQRILADLYHHHTGKRHPDAPPPREL